MNSRKGNQEKRRGGEERRRREERRREERIGYEMHTDLSQIWDVSLINPNLLCHKSKKKKKKKRTKNKRT